MATYDYTCFQCEHTFEKNVPVESRNSAQCPKCGLMAPRSWTFNGLVYAPTAGGMR